MSSEDQFRISRACALPRLTTRLADGTHCHRRERANGSDIGWLPWRRPCNATRGSGRRGKNIPNRQTWGKPWAHARERGCPTERCSLGRSLTSCVTCSRDVEGHVTRSEARLKVEPDSHFGGSPGDSFLPLRAGVCVEAAFKIPGTTAVYVSVRSFVAGV